MLEKRVRYARVRVHVTMRVPYVSIEREYRIIATGLSTSRRDPLQRRAKTGSMVKTSSVLP